MPRPPMPWPCGGGGGVRPGAGGRGGKGAVVDALVDAVVALGLLSILLAFGLGWVVVGRVVAGRVTSRWLRAAIAAALSAVAFGAVAVLGLYLLLVVTWPVRGG